MRRSDICLPQHLNMTTRHIEVVERVGVAGMGIKVLLPMVEPDISNFSGVRCDAAVRGGKLVRSRLLGGACYHPHVMVCLPALMVEVLVHNSALRLDPSDLVLTNGLPGKG
eukprot:3312583-Amphidinium_carterae.2